MSIRFFQTKICPMDLFTGDNGRLASTKLWMHIAYGQMTYIMYWLRPEKPNWVYFALFCAYGAIVGGSALAAKFIGMKFGADQPDTTINQPAGPINIAGDVKVKGKK